MVVLEVLGVGDFWGLFRVGWGGWKVEVDMAVALALLLLCLLCLLLYYGCKRCCKWCLHCLLTPAMAKHVLPGAGTSRYGLQILGIPPFVFLAWYYHLHPSWLPGYLFPVSSRCLCFCSVPFVLCHIQNSAIGWFPHFHPLPKHPNSPTSGKPSERWRPVAIDS